MCSFFHRVVWISFLSRDSSKSCLQTFRKGAGSGYCFHLSYLHYKEKHSWLRLNPGFTHVLPELIYKSTCRASESQWFCKVEKKKSFNKYQRNFPQDLSSKILHCTVGKLHQIVFPSQVRRRWTLFLQEEFLFPHMHSQMWPCYLDKWWSL